MVIGIHKGNKFELLIYKDLRMLGHCKRTIGSGSSDEPGDILFEKYAIECKHYKQVRWTWLHKVWKKLEKETKEYNKMYSNTYILLEGKRADDHFEPIIIFRQNREPIMVMCLMSCKDKTFKGVTSYDIWKQLIGGIK